MLARNEEQRAAVSELKALNVVVPERAVDGRSLVAYADVLVSAGGTMNREAAVLGTPVWSIFEGRTRSVDEKLVEEGRLKILRDPDQVSVERKPADAFERRTRRDLADLLRLAILAPGRSERTFHRAIALGWSFAVRRRGARR